MPRDASTVFPVLGSALAVAVLLAAPAVAAAQAFGAAPPETPDPVTAASEAPDTDAPSSETPGESPLERRDRERLELLAASGLERAVLETPAGRLVYWQGGEGPPLVLLHGSGDSAGTWAATARELAGEHRLLIPDLPGHGASEPAAGALSFATIVAGLEALLDAVQLDSPVLAGNSMGAWLAMLQAHKAPASVSRVVAINGGAILGEPSEVKLMPADREEARQAMAGIRDPSSPPIPDEVLDDIVARAASGPIRRMMMDLGGMMAYLLDGKLGEITTPVDLLWGESDRLMKLSYAEKMAAGLPRARITRIPKCGHIPQSECPERFVGLLRQVLAMEPPPAPEPETPELRKPEPGTPEPQMPQPDSVPDGQGAAAEAATAAGPRGESGDGAR